MSRVLCLLVALLLGLAQGCATMRAEAPVSTANQNQPAFKVDAQWWTDEANMSAFDRAARDDLLAAIKAETARSPIVESNRGQTQANQDDDVKPAKFEIQADVRKPTPHGNPPVDDQPPVTSLDDAPKLLVVGTDSLPIDSQDTPPANHKRRETADATTSTYLYTPPSATDDHVTIEVPRVKVKGLMQDAGGRHAAVVEIDGAGTHVCRAGDTVAIGDGGYIEIRKITNKHVTFGLSGSAKDYVIQ